MPGIVGVLGLCPGLVVRLPGEPGRVKRRVLRAWVIGAGWWRLTRAGESGRRRGGGHGALGVGRRFADGVPAWEEAPVIHSVARGGPECRAGLGGSINLTAVLLGVVEEQARHRSVANPRGPHQRSFRPAHRPGRDQRHRTACECRREPQQRLRGQACVVQGLRTSRSGSVSEGDCDIGEQAASDRHKPSAAPSDATVPSGSILLVSVTRVKAGEGRATPSVGVAATAASVSGGSAAGEVDALDRVELELYGCALQPVRVEGGAQRLGIGQRLRPDRPYRDPAFGG